MSDLHRLIDRRSWERVRRYVLDRDRWRCTSCGRPGHEVDHKTPLQMGGAPLDQANLQTLCRTCHIAKTRRENEHPLGPESTAWRARLSSSLHGVDGARIVEVS